MNKFVKQSHNGCQWFVCESYRDGYYILKVFYSEDKAKKMAEKMSYKEEIDG